MNWNTEPLTLAIIPALISAIVSFVIAKITLKSSFYQGKVGCICERVENLLDSAELYWSHNGNNLELERKIKAQFQYINNDIADLNDRLRQKHCVEDKLRRFRREVTGGSFESAQKVNEPGRITQIREFAADFSLTVKKCMPKI